MTNREFIEKIAPMVQEVFCDYRGVNPSVVIAQAISESGYGTSKLSKYNNIFGLNNYNYEKMETFDNLMDCIELFAKKMKKKEGGTVTKYLTKIIKKDTGEKVSYEVKFYEEISKPKTEKCPCYVEIDEEWVDHSMEGGSRH